MQFAPRHPSPQRLAVRRPRPGSAPPHRRPAAARRTPAPASPRGTARAPGRGCASSSESARSSRCRRRAPAAVDAARRPSSSRSSTIRCGSSIDGRASARGQTALLPVEQAPRAPQRTVPQQPHPVQLLARRPVRPSWRHRSAWRPRTSATRSSSGRVRLVPDRRDDRRAAGRDRPDQLLVGERQQVLHAAAAPRHDDHIDLAGRVELLHRLDDLRHRVRALHGRLRTSKRTAGQRRRAFSSTSRSAAEARPLTSPISCGRKGSGRLRSARTALRRPAILQLLQPGQQLADPTGRDLRGPQRQLPPRRVPLRLGVDDDPGALAHHVGDRVEDLTGSR